MKTIIVILLAVLMLGASAPASAHHAFAAEFDAASFIKLADGTVQRLGQDVEGIFGTKIWR